MTVTAYTIDGNTYYGYLTVAETDAVLAIEPAYSADWSALPQATKELYIVNATQRIDDESFLGRKTVATQPLDFPRTGLVCDGENVDPNTIPPQIGRATALLAGILAGDPNATNGQPGSGTQDEVQSFAVGSFRIQLDTDDNVPARGVIGNETITRLLACFLSGTGRPNAVGAAQSFGTDGTSIFENRQAPELIRGFS